MEGLGWWGRGAGMDGPDMPACPRGFALRELCRVSTAGGGVIDTESLALLYLLQERT